MTLDQWATDESLQKRFADMMNSPEMQAALALARQEIVPQPRTVEDPSGIVTLYALDYARSTGWHGALSFLDRLQRVRPAKKVPERKPWTHKEHE
jgi:hypothetical protein